MEDILIITSYYPPEIGAASNRIYHLANGLKSDYNVTVLTPLPNYPTGDIFKAYRGKFRVTQVTNDVKIIRLWLFASNSKNKFVRLLAMLSYSFSLFWYFIWNKIPKKVIVQSPPLLVAFTSMFFLKSKRRKLILNISDLWPTAAVELGALKKGFTYKVLKKVEHFNYKTADIILGQSNEILDHVKTIARHPKLFLYRNYPVIDKNVSKKRTSKNGQDLKLVYAGLLGVAQGIYNLCTSINYENIELHIYGSGAEEKQIKEYIEANSALPIFFHGTLERSELHTELMTYDVALIPLLHRIYGSVPSKIFEYAKLGIPLLYFGGGEGESIVRAHQLGWVTKAGDYEELNKTIQGIGKTEINKALNERIKTTAEKVFDFETQLQELKRIL